MTLSPSSQSRSAQKCVCVRRTARIPLSLLLNSFSYLTNPDRIYSSAPCRNNCSTRMTSPRAGWSSKNEPPELSTTITTRQRRVCVSRCLTTTAFLHNLLQATDSPFRPSSSFVFSAHSVHACRECGPIFVRSYLLLVRSQAVSWNFWTLRHFSDVRDLI